MARHTLDDSIQSWLDGEDTIRWLADEAGGKLADEIDALYWALIDPNTSRKAKADTTRRLRELQDVAVANLGGRGPKPHVSATEWHWGRPGSAEDRELLEAT